MLKNIVKFEVQIGEKIYHLLCDNDSPINDVKEALFQITKAVAEVEQKITALNKQAQEESKPAEVPEQEEEAK